MNYKKVIFLLASISLFLFFGIVLTSVFLSLAIAQRGNLVFCFSPGCFEFAAKAFLEPIKVFKVGVEFGAYSFAAIGAATAILTYRNSVRSEKYNRHIQKSSDFKKYTEELVREAGSGVKPQDFNVNRYYNFMFPLSVDAQFVPGELYVSILQQMDALVEQTNIGFVPGSVASFQDHYYKMMDFFHVLGISIEEPTEELLIILEPKIFMFIDSINKQFSSIELQLHRRSRDYARLVSVL
jgi:hypothetical protein